MVILMILNMIFESSHLYLHSILVQINKFSVNHLIKQKTKKNKQTKKQVVNDFCFDKLAVTIQLRAYKIIYCYINH